MLGFGQAHGGPGLAAVQAFVDPVAEPDMAAADVLARADPDGFGRFGIDRQAADGIRPLPVEYRRPGRSGVLRLPDAARARGHIPDGMIFGVNSHVADASGHDGRSDGPKFQPGEKLRSQEELWRFGLAFKRDLRRGGKRRVPLQRRQSRVSAAMIAISVRRLMNASDGKYQGACGAVKLA